LAAWVGRQDEAGLFCIVPFQTCPSPPMTPALRQACREAVHVVSVGGQIWRGGRAVLAVWHGLGQLSARWLAVLSRPPLGWAIEGAYRLGARYRAWWGRWLS